AIPLQSLFPSATADAIDLLQKLLTFDPRKRLSATKLYHDPKDEPDCLPPDSSYLEFDLDGKYEETVLKGLLYEEVIRLVKFLPKLRVDRLECIIVIGNIFAPGSY
ncbi:hypothetical protein B0H14DRAFT_2734264, partial [Mycena olivaceomarginata]